MLAAIESNRCTRRHRRRAARPLCCGRTYLAQGMVEEARAEVRRLVDALLPHVEAGRVIVGLEASCVLGLRDDARALGLEWDA
jgi:glycerol-3-phosphate dehydrogenase subunit C